MKNTKTILNNIEGAGGKGGGNQRIPNEAPNTLRSVQTISTVEVLSEGPVKGIVGEPDILKGVFFDKTPVQSFSDEFNFSGVTAQFREGLPSQTPMAGFPGTEDIYSINTELLNGNNVTRLIGSDKDAVRVIITLPSGLSRLNEENGDLEGFRVEFSVDIRLDGGTWEQALIHEISGKSVTTYSEAHRIERPTGAGVWEVRIRRRSPYQESARITETMFVSSIVEITDLDLSYDNTAVAGISVDAESTGGAVPIRSFLLDGLELMVPDNYNPTVYNPDGSVASYASYTGTWDGITFKQSWTDDPAWIVYNMLINDRWGLGFDANDIDQYSFYEASQYNIELIPRSVGDPTLEPRFTFNGPIATRNDPYQVLQSIASNCRSVLYASAGLVRLIQDRPTEPITIINQSNVIDGMFTYSSTERNDRFTSVNVTYNDIDNRYNPRTINERASQEAFDQFGLVHAEMDAIGVVRESQARRIAKWALDSTLNNSELVEFSVGWSESLVDVGDVFYLADNDYADVQFSGTVHDVTGAVGSQTIKIDRSAADITLPATIVLLSTSGTETEVTIDSIGGADNDELVTSTGTDLTPFMAAEYVITDANISPRQFKVTGIKEEEEGVYNFTAVEFDPAKFDRVELGIDLDGPPDMIGDDEIAKPTGISYDIESVITPSSTIRFRVRLNWNMSNDPFFSHYLVRWRRNADQYTASNELTQPQFIIEDALPGFYEVMINAVNTRGIMSPPALKSFLVDVDGQVSPIGAISGLQLVGGGTVFNSTQFTVEWTEPSALGGAVIKDYLVSLVLDDIDNTPAKIYVTTNNTQTITRSDVIEAYGEAIRNPKVQVVARDSLNRISDDEVVQTFTNPAPAAVTGITATPQIGSYKIDHAAPPEADAEGIKIWHSTTTGFAPGPSTLVKDDLGTSHIVEANEDTEYFFVLAAYDTWTRDSDKLIFSGEGSVTTNFDPTNQPDPTQPLVPVVSSNINTLLNGTQVANILITWTKVNDANAYDVEITEDGTLLAIPIVSQPDAGTQVTFQFNGDIGKEYCFRIRSRSGSNISAWTATPECVTQGQDTTSAAVPTGITATPTYQGALVQWTNPSSPNFEGTEVWRRTGGVGDGTKIGDVARPTAFFFDDGLDIGTTYEYRVRSKTFAGEVSNYSTWASVTASNVPDSSITANALVANTITANEIAAGTITAAQLSTGELITVSAQIGDAVISSAKLQGTIQSDNFVSGTSGWQITRNLGTAEFGDLFARGDLVTGISPDFRTEITRPDNATDYVIWSGSGTKNDANAVFFVRADGSSEYTGTVPGASIDVGSAPPVPTLAVSSSRKTLPGPSQQASFDVSWNATSGADRYEVQAQRAGIVQATTVVGTTEFNWLGDIGIAYSFRVRALNEFGVRSAWSNEVTRTVAASDGTPSAPTGLSGAAVYAGAILDWTNAVSDNLKSIEVWRRLGTGTSAKIGEVSEPGNVYVDNGLTIGSTYRYKLRSKSIGGNFSGFTAEVVITADNVASGSITNTSISDNSISTPKLQANSVVASKIAANTITAAKIAAGTITATELSAGELITGSAQIGDALITSAKLAGDIQSDNYVAGSAGWKISRNTGSAEFGEIDARGSLTAGTSPNQRVIIDSSGTYRIWVGSGSVSDANGIFWVKNDGTAKINASTFGITEGGYSVSAANASGSNSGFSACGSVTSSAASVTINGGVGPFTYQWTHIGTSNGNTPSIGSSTAASPSWTANVCDGTPSVSTWKVVVTDNDGNVAESVMGVTLTWVDLN